MVLKLYICLSLPFTRVCILVVSENSLTVDSGSLILSKLPIGIAIGSKDRPVEIDLWEFLTVSVTCLPSARYIALTITLGELLPSSLTCGLVTFRPCFGYRTMISGWVKHTLQLPHTAWLSPKALPLLTDGQIW